MPDMQLPATMRAVQIMAPGRAEFIETPLPELRPGHALVRTRLLSLCGSDVQWLHYLDPAAYPLAPRHHRPRSPRRSRRA